MTRSPFRAFLNALQGLNPYGIDAGAELDQLIHQHCFNSQGEVLPFSTEQKAADRVKARVKTIHGFPVATGETKLRTRRFFARLETGPSTATEVLAETMPLAICRLALVVTLRTAQSAAILAFFFVD